MNAVDIYLLACVVGFPLMFWAIYMLAGRSDDR